ncbi:hypothetical protein SAMN05880570_1016 [Paenibacillus sp. RU4T]|nr:MULTISPECIES: hypothetical protein [unclassified Paenibacillus]ASS65868.1 hypothetical protein CIC07_06725 [Paenibacillus sp. RUD330]SIQ20793.1 hypothetical protein SAMN05880555_1017 [Paenibacillus sp. RU4X]SIQ42467.1 hypothetical protein SAMN05880570_1016 [Paenibacillus sp. RU4T]
MHKTCSCGHKMNMKLRTVIYSNKVEIDNVPIYSCAGCGRSEVLPEVKPDLTGLIGQLGEEPGKQTFLFNELNEWADLLVEASSKRRSPDPAAVQQIVGERIDSLLELLLVAGSVGDEAWRREIEKRLGQLSRCMMHT